MCLLILVEESEDGVLVIVHAGRADLLESMNKSLAA